MSDEVLGVLTGQVPVSRNPERDCPACGWRSRAANLCPACGAKMETRRGETGPSQDGIGSCHD